MISSRNLMLALLLVAATAPAVGNAIDASVELRVKSSIDSHVGTLWRDVATAFVESTKAQVQVSALTTEDFADVDLVELGLHDAIAACDDGELNLLPLNDLLMDKSVTSGEYISNSIQPCAIGHSVWADVVAFSAQEWSQAEAPVLLADFFNTEVYPGKRAIKKSARGLFEWILINEGYRTDQIYTALSQWSTREVLENALSDMLEDILWVESDAEALDLINSGEAVFAAVSSHNLVREVFQQLGHTRNAKNPYGVIWSGAIAHMNLLGIPKNDSANDALELLNFATRSEHNLKVSTAYGYAPVRTDQAVIIKEWYRPVLPFGEHLGDVVWGNKRWWRENGGLLEVFFLELVGEPWYDGKLSAL